MNVVVEDSTKEKTPPPPPPIPFPSKNELGGHAVLDEAWNNEVLDSFCGVDFAEPLVNDKGLEYLKEKSKYQAQGKSTFIYTGPICQGYFNSCAPECFDIGTMEARLILVIPIHQYSTSPTQRRYTNTDSRLREKESI